MPTVSDTMTPEQGLLQLSELNAQAKDRPFAEVLVDLLNRKVPTEIVTRLEDLWEITKKAGGEIIQIGKIIVLQIVDFVRANPDIAIALAIGGAAGALIGLIPYIGPFLQPLMTAVVAILVAGRQKGALEDAVLLAKKFYELLANIFMAVRQYWVEG